jgi:DNA mismatch endonuclease (patch repair protein)|tara:strand:+ start:232 stop:414 length:183 start_codon:yes stop_codon:yes gene_type:complete
MPKTNVGYWKPKFERNVERDKSKQERLVNLGWDVRTIWECEVNSMEAEILMDSIEIFQRY